MLDTKKTVEEIQDALIKQFGNYKTDIIVPNVSYGLFDYEADLIIMTNTGYATEFDIKRSFSDFNNDFKKDKCAHNSPIIYRFYYVVPSSIGHKVIDVLKDKYKHIPGVLTYDEDLKLKSIGLSGGIREGGRKMFLEEQFKLARLGYLRYWKLKGKI